MAGLCHAQSEMNYELWAATAFRPLYSDNEPLSSLSSLHCKTCLDKGASFAAEVLPLARPEEQISRGANGIIKTERAREGEEGACILTGSGGGRLAQFRIEFTGTPPPLPD